MDLRINRLFRFAFLLIIMTLLCILFTGFSYANSTATITLEGYTYSYYDDGTKPEYNMHGVFSSNLGNPVYCGNHAYPAPTGSDIGSSITKEMNDYHDSLVRKILYYGYKGPKEWSGFSNSEYNDVYRAYDHEGKTKWCGIAVTGIALTKAQNKGYVYDVSGFNEFWSYVNSMPEPPESFKAYIMYGNTNEQNLFTWQYNPNPRVAINIKKVYSETGLSVHQGGWSFEGTVYGVFSDELLNNKVGEIIIDSSGNGTMKNVLPGKYYISELVSPEGYCKNNEVIEVNAIATSDEIEYYEYDVISEESPVTIEINKYEYLEDESVLLEGASLQLLNERGEVIYSWTSSNVPYTIKGLSAGKYILREVEAPEGYQKAEDVCIEVLETDKVQYFDIENKLKPKVYEKPKIVERPKVEIVEEIHVPDTGDFSEINVFLSLIIVSFLCILWSGKRLKKY